MEITLHAGVPTYDMRMRIISAVKKTCAHVLKYVRGTIEFKATRKIGYAVKTPVMETYETTHR